MCGIEKLRKDKDVAKKIRIVNKIYIVINVVTILLLRIIAFGYAVEVVAFLSRHYSYLNAIADCVAIKWIIALVWIIYWCIGLKTKKILMIQDKGKSGKIRFEKVIEDYDRYGIYIER